MKSARSFKANFVSIMVFLKAVILIGGPQKGTRFRPLSLGIPKPLFPISGIPLVQHHIEALARVKIVKGWYNFTTLFSNLTYSGNHINLFVTHCRGLSDWNLSRK